MIKEQKEINTIIENLKRSINQTHKYNDKRWKRSWWNPGVYSILVNIQQLTIIHKALKKLNKQENQAHLQQKWNKMTKEIFEDYEERIKK